MSKQQSIRAVFLVAVACALAQGRPGTVAGSSYASLDSLKAHAKRTVTWDCLDAEGKLVKDGTYRIRVEFSEVNGSGPATPEDHIKFIKGPKAYSTKPKSLRNFTKMSLTYTPE